MTGRGALLLSSSAPPLTNCDEDETVPATTLAMGPARRAPRIGLSPRARRRAASGRSYRGDGSLRCANDRSRKATFAVPGRYSEISGSLANLCALAVDRRSVYCWGHSLLGRPTRPYIDTPLGPATVAPLPEPAQDLVVGDTHVCVTFSGERLTCWGANDRGQLGNGKAGTQIGPAPYPQR